MKSNDRLFLTAEQAISVIATDEESIHTFRSGACILIGADWRRDEIIKALNDAPSKSIEIGGESCIRIGHGLVLWTGNEPLFIEADTNKLEEIEKQLQP